MKKNWIDYFYALMNPTVTQKAHDFDDFGKNDFFSKTTTTTTTCFISAHTLPMFVQACRDVAVVVVVKAEMKHN
jgi:hypothetical protein